MNKRQRKKKQRDFCPKCGSGSGILAWRQLPTRRWVSVFLACTECNWGFEEAEDE